MDYAIRKFLWESRATTGTEGLEFDLLLSCKYRAQSGSLSLADLRRDLCLSQARLAGLLRRVLQRRWLERRKDRRGGRGVLIQLTAQGEARLAELSRRDRDHLQRQCQSFLASLGALAEKPASTSV